MNDGGHDLDEQQGAGQEGSRLQQLKEKKNSCWRTVRNTRPPNEQAAFSCKDAVAVGMELAPLSTVLH